MSVNQPLVASEALSGRSMTSSPGPADGGNASGFRDSAGGLFAGPACLVPEELPDHDEPNVRSIFALRGLFRL